MAKRGSEEAYRKGRASRAPNARREWIRALWRERWPSHEIVRVVSAGDKSRRCPPCDGRTVRSVLTELRTAAVQLEADEIPTLRAFIGETLRTNLARAVSLHDYAITKGEGPLAARAIEAIGKQTERYAVFYGLMPRAGVEVNIAVNSPDHLKLEALNAQELDALEAAYAKLLGPQKALEEARDEDDIIDVEMEEAT